MGSGLKSPAVGSLVGTAADLEVHTCGFRPRYVKVINVSSDNAKGEWLEGMADDSAVLTVTDGTISIITTNGITPLSDGFGLGADAELNVAGELVRFIAFE